MAEENKMKGLNIIHSAVIIVVTFIITIIAVPANAEKGVIVYMTSRCFVISTNSGYVIVDGWVSIGKGATVIGKFNKYGSTDIFDSNGNDVSGYIYIEDYGLSKSSLEDKWNDKYYDKCE